MSLYKQEFDLGFNLKEHPFLIDKIWHNDLCLSLFKAGMELRERVILN